MPAPTPSVESIDDYVRQLQLSYAQASRAERAQFGALTVEVLLTRIYERFFFPSSLASSSTASSSLLSSPLAVREVHAGVHDRVLPDVLPFAIHDVPALAGVAALQARIGARIWAAVATRPIVTLHELQCEVCLAEHVGCYEELGLGPWLSCLPLVQQFFQLRSEAEPLPVRSEQVVDFLLHHPAAQGIWTGSGDTRDVINAYAQHYEAQRHVQMQQQQQQQQQPKQQRTDRATFCYAPDKKNAPSDMDTFSTCDERTESGCVNNNNNNVNRSCTYAASLPLPPLRNNRHLGIHIQSFSEFVHMLRQESGRAGQVMDRIAAARRHRLARNAALYRRLLDATDEAWGGCADGAAAGAPCGPTLRQLPSLTWRVYLREQEARQSSLPMCYWHTAGDATDGVLRVTTCATATEAEISASSSTLHRNNDNNNNNNNNDNNNNEAVVSPDHAGGVVCLQLQLVPTSSTISASSTRLDNTGRTICEPTVSESPADRLPLHTTQTQSHAAAPHMTTPVAVLPLRRRRGRVVCDDSPATVPLTTTATTIAAEGKESTTPSSTIQSSEVVTRTAIPASTGTSCGGDDAVTRRATPAQRTNTTLSHSSGALLPGQTSVPSQKSVPSATASLHAWLRQCEAFQRQPQEHPPQQEHNSSVPKAEEQQAHISRTHPSATKSGDTSHNSESVHVLVDDLVQLISGWTAGTVVSAPTLRRAFAALANVCDVAGAHTGKAARSFLAQCEHTPLIPIARRPTQHHIDSDTVWNAEEWWELVTVATPAEVSIDFAPPSCARRTRPDTAHVADKERVHESSLLSCNSNVKAVMTRVVEDNLRGAEPVYSLALRPLYGADLVPFFTHVLHVSPMVTLKSWFASARLTRRLTDYAALRTADFARAYAGSFVCAVMMDYYARIATEAGSEAAKEESRARWRLGGCVGNSCALDANAKGVKDACTAFNTSTAQTTSLSVSPSSVRPVSDWVLSSQTAADDTTCDAASASDDDSSTASDDSSQGTRNSIRERTYDTVTRVMAELASSVPDATESWLLCNGEWRCAAEGILYGGGPRVCGGGGWYPPDDTHWLSWTAHATLSSSPSFAASHGAAECNDRMHTELKERPPLHAACTAAMGGRLSGQSVQPRCWILPHEPHAAVRAVLEAAGLTAWESRIVTLIPFAPVRNHSWSLVPHKGGSSSGCGLPLHRAHAVINSRRTLPRARALHRRLMALLPYALTFLAQHDAMLSALGHAEMTQTVLPSLRVGVWDMQAAGTLCVRAGGQDGVTLCEHMYEDGVYFTRQRTVRLCYVASHCTLYSVDEDVTPRVLARELSELFSSVYHVDEAVRCGLVELLERLLATDALCGNHEDDEDDDVRTYNPTSHDHTNDNRKSSSSSSSSSSNNINNNNNNNNNKNYDQDRRPRCCSSTMNNNNCDSVVEVRAGRWAMTEQVVDASLMPVADAFWMHRDAAHVAVAHFRRTLTPPAAPTLRFQDHFPPGREGCSAPALPSHPSRHMAHHSAATHHRYSSAAERAPGWNMSHLAQWSSDVFTQMQRECDASDSAARAGHKRARVEETNHTPHDERHAGEGFVAFTPRAAVSSLTARPATGSWGGGGGVGDAQTTAYAMAAEKFVYDELRRRYAHDSAVEVCWINEHAESGSPYDIVITRWVRPTNSHHGRRRDCVGLVEVKSTSSSNRHDFELSLRELLCAARYGAAYHVYRVYGASTSPMRRMKMRCYTDVVQMWYTGRLSLTGNVRVLPTSM